MTDSLALAQALAPKPPSDPFPRENTFLLVLDSIAKKLKAVHWNNVFRNPNLTLKYISEHPSFPWRWSVLASNPCMTYEELTKHTTHLRDLIEFAQNRNATLEILEGILEKCDTNGKRELFFEKASKNPNVNLEFVLKHENEKWWWCELLHNKNIPFQKFLEKRSEEERTEGQGPQEERDENWFSNNEYEEEWRESIYMSACASLTISDVLAHSEFDWDWVYLSKHPNITLSDILSHSELPWEWEFVSENPNLTIEFVKENKEKDWDWSRIARNPGITPKELRKSKLQKLYRNIECNPNFTCEDTKTFFVDPELAIYNNINITYEYIKKHELMENCYFTPLITNKYRNDDFFTSVAYRNRMLKKHRKFFMENIFDELIAKACTPERTPNWSDDWNENHPLWGYL